VRHIYLVAPPPARIDVSGKRGTKKRQLVAEAITARGFEVAREVPPLCFETRVGPVIFGKGEVTRRNCPIEAGGIPAGQDFSDCECR
jgi:hypothetical protein